MVVKTPQDRRHRSFSKKKQEGEVVPLGFDLEGEEFVAHPEIPGAVLLDFMSAAGEDGAGTANAIFPFFESALPAEDYARFDKLIHDPEINIDIETLVEIVGYLVEAYSDSRPS